jgi:hypothetical protein
LCRLVHGHRRPLLITQCIYAVNDTLEAWVEESPNWPQ